MARHAGVHAAGVVISKDPLVEYVPLYRGNDGQAITAYEMGILEKQLGYRSGIQAPKTADGRSNLRPIGILRGTVKFEGKSLELDIYVMDNLSQPILSRSACFGLGIFSSRLMSSQSQ